MTSLPYSSKMSISGVFPWEETGVTLRGAERILDLFPSASPKGDGVRCGADVATEHQPARDLDRRTISDSSMTVELRHLAHRGDLAHAAVSLPKTTVVELRRAAYGIAWRIVYDRHTRKLELGKGHRECALSIKNMASGCLDRFHDDVEAVIDYLFVRADSAIHNLEGWIATWLRAATVDGYRRRRGELGAQQRPRVPKWLATRLDDDPWLVRLASQIIEWVGVPASAGREIWPIDAWTDLRGSIVGDWRGSEPAVVAREVEEVLTTMRAGNLAWYTRYIELPLGRKPAAVAFTDATAEGDHAALPLTTCDDRDEANLARRATLAVEAIGSQLDRGEDPREVIPRIVKVLFLGPGAAADDIDWAPHEGEYSRDAKLSAALADVVVTRRIITAVLDIVGLREVG